jgi:pyruvate/2-oxoglutarate dehydrogenase complex dihydrolipoamide dehydrogenase (E3) component
MPITKQTFQVIGDVTPGQALAHVASAEGICREKRRTSCRTYRLRKRTRLYVCNSEIALSWFD